MTDDRLEREAHFHDHTEAAGVRRAAAKFYEVAASSQRKYREWILDGVEGQRVLEYGCGTGSSAFDIARAGGSAVGIDISPVRIATARERAAALGMGDRISFTVGNAEALPFDDASFDRVIGSAILHHLDLPVAVAEIGRVLRPDGSAYFVEPLGHNPLINWYRRRTPEMRTSDEHPLVMSDLRAIRRAFPATETEFFHLFALGIVPIRRTPLFKPSLYLADRLDAAVFTLVPPARPLAWLVVIRMLR